MSDDTGASSPVDPRGGAWLEENRATWDERVPLHLAGDFYDQSALKSGAGRLTAIEEDALARMFPGGLEGKRVLHLQCHFGADTLVLAHGNVGGDAEPQPGRVEVGGVLLVVDEDAHGLEFHGFASLRGHRSVICDSGVISLVQPVCTDPVN